MGRPRKPTNILELKGAFKANPQRREQRKFEPKNLPALGDCPDWFSEVEKKAWADLVRCAPAGVLTSADEQSMELAARLLARSREAQIVRNNVTGELYAITGLTSAEHGQLIQLLGKFGMNPADRSRVSVQQAEPVSEWGKFGA